MATEPGTGRQVWIGRVGLAKGSRKNNFTFLCADASCLAVLPKRRNIAIFLRFGALPGRRLNT
jgi:hypothetical protein